MPIAPRFHIDAVRELSMQLSRAPESIRNAQMVAAEKLLYEIDEMTLYPFDYMVYRITGYREDEANQPMLLGSALIGDLVALIAIISKTLHLPAEGMLDVEHVAQKLGVSTRTLSRLRREGLVFYWVVEDQGRSRLGCSLDMLEAFTSRNKERILRASRFTRLSKEEKKEVIDLALEYRGEKRTLSEVAAEVSKHSKRGLETIRLLLQQHESTLTSFEQPPSVTRNDSRDIEKALQSGISWKALSTQYKRTVGALRKSLARLRATRLKQMHIEYVDLEIFSREDAEEVILGAPASQLVTPIVLTMDILQSNTNGNYIEKDETAIVSAMHLLRRRALMNIKLLGYSPQEKIIDRIETDFRWSFLLQQELILKALPSSLAVAVQHAGRPLHELPENKSVAFVQQVIRSIGNTCGLLDPSKGQTAMKTPASVLDRTLALTEMQLKPRRAAATYKAVEIRCPFHKVVPWTSLLPTTDLPLVASAESSELERVVALRFGWRGPPRTAAEIAIECGRSPMWVTRQLRLWA